ncbi:MAG: mevalonate kinase [Candidatus Diapherotrites archaeon]|nr:mevalonate kinase [Candidatus Diapherotrites archaeon]
MSEAYGYGKVILFGEHFVVYGIPAIAAGISKKTVATIGAGDKPGIEIVDNRPAVEGYKEKYAEQQEESVGLMGPAFGVDFGEKPVKITLGGELFCASGVGASAASCVAIARAISGYFRLGLSDEKINAIAYEGEKAYAGNPSGIDNTASTYGGLVYFVKNFDRPNTMERPVLKAPLYVIMASTGITTKTKVAVEGVRQRKEQEPEKYAGLFKEAEALVAEARKALEEGNAGEVGALMAKNHGLLQQIGVSCEELDGLVDAANSAGAVGAKMTGGGMGGYMVALVRQEDQDRISDELTRAGATHTIKAEIR